MTPVNVLDERMLMCIQIYNYSSVSSVNAGKYPAKERTCLVETIGRMLSL